MTPLTGPSRGLDIMVARNVYRLLVVIGPEAECSLGPPLYEDDETSETGRRLHNPVPYYSRDLELALAALEYAEQLVTYETTLKRRIISRLWHPFEVRNLQRGAPHEICLQAIDLLQKARI